MPVQTVLFDKKVWTDGKARQWLSDHGFVWGSPVHETAHFLRYRQSPPMPGARYFTQSIGRAGISLVIEVEV